MGKKKFITYDNLFDWLKKKPVDPNKQEVIIKQNNEVKVVKKKTEE